MMKTIITSILVCLGIFALAQNPSLKERELLVQKDYSNEIYNVNPLFNYASITTSKRSKLDFGADSLSRLDIFTPDMNVSIQPIAYKSFDPYKGKNGFAKVDYGTLNPLHAQAGYVYSKPNYFNLQAGFDYDNRNEQNVPNKTVISTSASVGMDYYVSDQVKTDLSIDYNRNKLGLFSNYPTTDAESNDNFNQFSSITLQLGLATFRVLPDNWNFGITGQFSNWTNHIDDGTEKNIETRGHLDVQINDKWGIYLQPEYQLSNSVEYGDATIFSSSFRITYNGTNFYSRTGVQTNRIDQDWQFWPDADIRWNVTTKTSLHLRSHAQAVILGADQVSQINPYFTLGSEKEIAYYRNIDADITAALSENSSINVHVAYQNAQDDVNFILGAKDTRRFELEHVDFERQRIRLAYNHQLLGDAINAGLSIQYDRYSKNMASLLHRPTLFIAPSIQARAFDDKLSVTITGAINNPQSLDRIPGARTESTWRKDVSSEITFRINDHINVNLNADNIFNADYDVWNGYNNFGRNLSGGLLVKF